MFKKMKFTITEEGDILLEIKTRTSEWYFGKNESFEAFKFMRDQQVPIVIQNEDSVNLNVSIIFSIKLAGYFLERFGDSKECSIEEIRSYLMMII